MPCSTGPSSISLVLPIRPRPSARSVPRWRSDWLIWLRTCVSFSFAIGRHLLRRLVGKDLGDLLAARLRDFLGTAQLAQCDLGCLQHVDRVRRAERLREHVADAAELEHRAHASTGDDAGTGRRRAQEHARRIEATDRLVRDRLTVLRHGEHVLPRVVDGLRDREWDLARLPVADTDAIDLVTHHDERGEREAATALDDLRDAVDLDHALLELPGLLHVDGHLESQSSFARAVGECLDATVVQVAAAVEHDGFDSGLLRGCSEALADLGRLLGLVALERLRQVEPRRGGERAPRVVVDQLREDTAVRAKNEHARTVGRAADLPAHAAVAAEARFASRKGAHARFPTFRRTYSPS